MDSIPEGWEISRLKQVADLIVPMRDKPKKFDGNIPWIRIEDLDGKYISDSKSVRRVSKKIVEEMLLRVYPLNTVICSCSGNMGVCAITKKELTSNQTFIGIHPKEALISDYLYYYMIYSKTELEKIGSGTTLKYVSRKKFENLEIPIPPLNEQVRIVGRVEELFSRLDAGVRSLQAAQTQLEQYRQTTLKQAYTGKLTEKWRQKLSSKDTSKIPNSPSKDYWNIPSSWEWKRLEMIAEINPKLPINEIADNLEVTFMPMASVEEETGKIDLSEIKQYGQVKKGYTKFFDGDIIFAKITPCMENGKVAIVKGLSNKIGIGSTEFHVIRLDNTLVKEFYFYYLLQKWFRSLAQQHFTGTVGHRRVPTDFIKKAYVPVPPIEEQKEIVSKLEEMNTFFYHEYDIIRKTLKNSSNLKYAILKKAFEGRLVPQDPNEEPASLLLERIKAQIVKQRKLM